MKVTSEPWGRVADGAVTRWTLDVGKATVRVLDYGGILQSVDVPDRRGRVANVALGFANIDDYVQTSPYFGCLVGRYANRLADGRFTLDGTAHHVPVNDGPHALHGGTTGFDRRIWSAEPFASDGSIGLVLSLVSRDGDQGFPGELQVRATYTLRAPGDLRIDYIATTDAPTVVNLTNHAYWNLAGEGTGDVYAHRLRLRASRYTPIDERLIPTGGVDDVSDTPMDFRRTAAIGARLRGGFPQLVLARGYDHNWVLDGPGDERLRVAARVVEPGSGRVLTVRTDQPGIQFYSGNFLDGTLVGTGGRSYRQGDGFALETQHFPDSPNQPSFPSTVLRPDETYSTTTIYSLGVSG